MTSITRRVVATAAAAVGGILLVSGCQAHPGEAAYVGQQAISTDQLQSVFQRSLTGSVCGQRYAAQPVVLERIKLSDLIMAQVLTDIAARHGVTVTDADVQTEIASLADHFGFRTALEQQASTTGAVAPQDLPASVRVEVLRTKIADKLTSSIQVSDQQLRQYFQQHPDNYLLGRARDIVVTDKSTANAYVAQLKQDPSQFGQLLAQAAKAHPHLQNQESVNRGGYIGIVPLGGLRSAGYPVQPGSVFAIQLQDGWNVIEVTSQLSFDDLRDQVRRDLLAAQRAQALQQAIRQELARVDVTVNPRFGRWDVQRRAVVAAGRPTLAGQQVATPTTLQCGTGQS